MNSLIKLLIFPIVYLFLDILVRSELLELYAPLQRTFYVLSIFNSGLLFVGTVMVLNKIRTRRFLYYSVLGIFTAYLVTAILGSYIFFYFNGFFPNYYTFEYFKNEPLSAFVLLRDTIKLQDIILFAFAFAGGVVLIHKLASIPMRNNTRSNLFKLFSVQLSLFILLVFMIKKYDQCLLVDSNFSAAITRHLVDFKQERKFTGKGLGARNPIRLDKVEEKRDFNVLVVVFESLRNQNLTVYGYKRKTTPNLSEFSKEHPQEFYVFKHPYAVSSTTMLAVPAVLTGVAPYQDPAIFYSQPFIWNYGQMLDYYTFFLSSHSLKWYRFDRFYAKEHFDHLWYKERSGFPFFNDLGINDQHTVAHLSDLVTAKRSKPFFGVVQLNATHYPYNVPKEFKKWSGTFVDEYDNSILYQDHVLGELFERMKKNGVLENTVIIFTSDHGESLKDHNNIGHVDSYYVETISVPLMMYIPNKISSQVNIRQLRKNLKRTVSTIDIAPTIVELLNLTENHQVQVVYKNYSGYSLFQPIPGDRAVITMNNNEVAKFKVGVSVVKGGLHYIHRMNIVPNREELYNLKKDPTEAKNLIDLVSKERLKFLTDEFAKYPACKWYTKWR